MNTTQATKTTTTFYIATCLVSEEFIGEGHGCRMVRTVRKCIAMTKSLDAAVAAVGKGKMFQVRAVENGVNRWAVARAADGRVSDVYEITAEAV